MDFNKDMLAYCGLYCEQCSFKVAYNTQDTKHLKPYPKQDEDEWPQENLNNYNYAGCKGNHCICGNCIIKLCATGKNVDTCADCNSFPCEHMDKFASDGFPHHKEAIDNLFSIRKHRVEAWFETLQTKLKCKCGARLSWYYNCPCIKKDC